MPRHARSRPPENEPDLPPVSVSSDSLRSAWQVARYLLPYRGRLVLMLACMAVSSLCLLAFPAVTGLLVNAATGQPGSLAAAAWAQDVNTVSLALVSVIALQSAAMFVQIRLFVEISERCLADLRRDTFGRLLRLPMPFHGQRRVGELASRIATDLTQIQDSFVLAVPQFLRQALFFAGSLVLIGWISLRLTLLMLAVLPALLILAVVFGRLIRRRSRQTQDRLAESNVIVEETLQGIASVKAFTNEDYEDARFQETLGRYLDMVLGLARYRGAFVSFIVFALFSAVILVLWYGARMVQAGGLTAGELTSFMLYTLFVAGSILSFAEMYSQLQKTLGATHRVRDILAEQPEPLQAPGEKSRRLSGEVVFEKVAFRYPSRPEALVLRGIDLAIHPGQRVALVGPSGAGKSTLTALLLRLYEPEKGRILLDGRDARDYGLLEVRRQMAIVPQDVILFGGSILDNIAYGRPGAGESEIVEAAQQANADEFIRGFPDGYQTRVGERGVQLSGGQRQRIAIARAILRDPAILILDEATSSLDSASERLVLQALERLMHGRTSLIIAHRLSTVRSADRIFVIAEGSTVESGTHADLMQQENSLYRMLVQLQLDHTDGLLQSEKEETRWPSQPTAPFPRTS